MNAREHEHPHASCRAASQRGMLPQPGSFRFLRAARLLKHADFDRVYQQGRRLFSADLTVFYRLRGDSEESGGPRVGFTVGRAFGGAVERNRVKRRLREAVRLNLVRLSAPADVVLHPKRTASGADFAQLLQQVERAFAQIQQRLKTGCSGVG